MDGRVPNAQERLERGLGVSCACQRDGLPNSRDSSWRSETTVGRPRLVRVPGMVHAASRCSALERARLDWFLHASGPGRPSDGLRFVLLLDPAD